MNTKYFIYYLLAVTEPAPILRRCSRTDTTICLNPDIIAVGPKYRKYGTLWLSRTGGAWPVQR